MPSGELAPQSATNVNVGLRNALTPLGREVTFTSGADARTFHVNDVERLLRTPDSVCVHSRMV
jgi:hypothetical protein